MSKLKDFLYFLADGRWHGLTEIAKATQLSGDEAERVAKLYAEFEFVTFDVKVKRVRIDLKLKELLNKEGQP